MLLNPFRQILHAIPGTRILQEGFGLLGAEVQDPVNKRRRWTITAVLAPIPGRAIGGVRARLEDQKGFVTFCNQRDLELLLGLADPEEKCHWLGSDYPEINSRDFYGLCADEEDLQDDMFDRELTLRASHPGVLPFGLEITRLVHVSPKLDVEEQNMMLYDCDQVSGLGPDPRFETMSSRWTRVGREAVLWTSI